MIYINDVGYTMCLTRYKDTVFKKALTHIMTSFNLDDPIHSGFKSSHNRARGHPPCPARAPPVVARKYLQCDVGACGHSNTVPTSQKTTHQRLKNMAVNCAAVPNVNE